MITVLLERQPPPPTEGASSRINAIVDHLRRVDPGFRVVVAEPHPRPDRGRMGRLFHTARRLPALTVRALRGSNRILLLSAPALPFFKTPSRIDLFLASAFLGLLRMGCRLTGSVLVLNLHDFRSLQLPDFGEALTPAAREIFRSMERRSLRASHYILAPGGDWPDYMVHELGVPRERLVDFPNGCIRPGPEASEPVELPGRIRFVYAGTMTPRGRGLETMVTEFRKVTHPDAALILLGPGGDWCREAAGGDPRVHYLGARPVHECIRILRSCDVALYPYPDLFYFAMTHTTNKMALYMTCGLPLLANRSRSVERFIRENDLGVVCSMDEMSARMEEMAADPSRLGPWKAAVGRMAPEFTWERIIDRAFETIARRERLAPFGGRSDG